MSVRAILLFLWSQVGWFACVLGAARGHVWLGPVVVAVSLAVHVGRRRERLREGAVLAVSALVGFLVDTALLRAGVVRISGAAFPPLWLVALWPNFISTTAEDGILRSLPRRPLLAAILGAIGGPLAYDAGARLGAIALGPNRLVSLAVVGLVWAAAVPALVTVRARLVPP